MRQSLGAILGLISVLISCSPLSQSPSSDLQAIEQWTEQANLAMQDGEPNKADSLFALAAEALELIYEQNPGDAATSARLGELYYQLGNFNASVAWYARSIQQDSSNMHAFYQLGRGAVQIGDTKLAQLMFLRAVSLDEADTLSQRVVQELNLTGEKLYGHGSKLFAAGDTSLGSGYKIFGISLLMTAFEMDSSRQDLAQRIVDYCYEIGDEEGANRYTRWTKEVSNL